MRPNSRPKPENARAMSVDLPTRSSSRRSVARSLKEQSKSDFRLRLNWKRAFRRRPRSEFERQPPSGSSIPRISTPSFFRGSVWRTDLTAQTPESRASSDAEQRQEESDGNWKAAVSENVPVHPPPANSGVLGRLLQRAMSSASLRKTPRGDPKDAAIPRLAATADDAVEFEQSKSPRKHRLSYRKSMQHFPSRPHTSSDACLPRDLIESRLIAAAARPSSPKRPHVRGTWKQTDASPAFAPRGLEMPAPVTPQPSSKKTSSMHERLRSRISSTSTGSLLAATKRPEQKRTSYVPRHAALDFFKLSGHSPSEAPTSSEQDGPTLVAQGSVESFELHVKSAQGLGTQPKQRSPPMHTPTEHPSAGTTQQGPSPEIPAEQALKEPELAKLLTKRNPRQSCKLMLDPKHSPPTGRPSIASAFTTTSSLSSTTFSTLNALPPTASPLHTIKQPTNPSTPNTAPAAQRSTSDPHPLSDYELFVARAESREQRHLHDNWHRLSQRSASYVRPDPHRQFATYSPLPSLSPPPTPPIHQRNQTKSHISEERQLLLLPRAVHPRATKRLNKRFSWMAGDESTTYSLNRSAGPHEVRKAIRRPASFSQRIQDYIKPCMPEATAPGQEQGKLMVS